MARFTLALGVHVVSLVCQRASAAVCENTDTSPLHGSALLQKQWRHSQGQLPHWWWDGSHDHPHQDRLPPRPSGSDMWGNANANARPSGRNVGDGESGTCHPVCTWKCIQQPCEELCYPECDAPQCQVRCKREASFDNCEMQCDERKCQTFCRHPCEDSKCPWCETKCLDPVCTMKCPHHECKEVCNSPACKWHCDEPSLGVDPIVFADVGGSIAEAVSKAMGKKGKDDSDEKVIADATQEGEKAAKSEKQQLGLKKELEIGIHLGRIIGKAVGEKMVSNRKRDKSLAKRTDSNEDNEEESNEVSLRQEPRLAIGKELGRELGRRYARRNADLISTYGNVQCQHPECELECSIPECRISHGYRDFPPLEEGWKIVKTFDGPADSSDRRIDEESAPKRALTPRGSAGVTSVSSGSNTISEESLGNEGGKKSRRRRRKDDGKDDGGALLQVAEGHNSSHTMAVQVSIVKKVPGSHELLIVPDEIIYLPVKSSA